MIPPEAYKQLSSLEKERVDSEASETLYAVFNAAHNATGWCGDLSDDCWQAGLPIMKEALAKLVLRTR